MSGLHKLVDDALFLWKNQRHESAFLLALVAIAAVAHKRYPKKRDGEAFEEYLRNTCLKISGVEFRGKLQPLEHIFYKWLRCQLVHEASLPMDIEFMPEGEPNWMSIRAGGAPEYLLKIGHGWFHHMIGSVKQSHEYICDLLPPALRK
jgi:hypothetical protein